MTDTCALDHYVDFTESDDERSFRAEFRSWLASRSPFPPLPLDDTERVARLTEWQRELFDGGWGAVSFPAAYGGRGLPARYEAIVLEELGRAGAPEAWHYGYVARVILEEGSEAQRQRFVRRALRGDERWCQGFSEPEAGSDLAAITTRARRGADGYTLHGQKVWTSEAHWADWCLLLARTGEAGGRHRGLSIFLLPTSAEGVTIRPFRQITGSYEFAEVFLDDVVVPAEQRIGEEGDGWRIAMATVTYERGPGDVGFVANLRRSHNALVRRARDAVSDPVHEREIARLHVLLGVLERRLRASLLRREDGTAHPAESSIDKLLLTHVEQELAHLAVHLHGSAVASGEDPESAHEYLWSRAASIYGGTSELQRTIIATRILGLPRS